MEVRMQEMLAWLAKEEQNILSSRPNFPKRPHEADRLAAIKALRERVLRDADRIAGLESDLENVNDELRTTKLELIGAANG